jgi:threonine/homoserine/homoserine lactone efflux protein
MAKTRNERSLSIGTKMLFSHLQLCVVIIVLGALFWVLGVLWDLAFAYLSGTIGTWLKRRPRLQTAQPRVEGSVYLGLAGWAAIAGEL